MRSPSRLLTRVVTRVQSVTYSHLGHRGAIYDLAFGCGDAFAVSVGDDGCAVQWRVDTPLQVYQAQERRRAEADRVRPVLQGLMRSSAALTDAVLRGGPSSGKAPALVKGKEPVAPKVDFVASDLRRRLSALLSFAGPSGGGGGGGSSSSAGPGMRWTAAMEEEWAVITASVPGRRNAASFAVNGGGAPGGSKATDGSESSSTSAALDSESVNSPPKAERQMMLLQTRRPGPLELPAAPRAAWEVRDDTIAALQEALFDAKREISALEEERVRLHTAVQRKTERLTKLMAAPTAASPPAKAPQRQKASRGAASGGGDDTSLAAARRENAALEEQCRVLQEHLSSATGAMSLPQARCELARLEEQLRGLEEAGRADETAFARAIDTARKQIAARKQRAEEALAAAAKTNEAMEGARRDQKELEAQIAAQLNALATAAAAGSAALAGGVA